MKTVWIDGKAHISGYKRWEESDTIALFYFFKAKIVQLAYFL